MILYKYITEETAKRILEGNAVSFTKPEYFNDPFDLPSYPVEKGDNPIASFFSGLRTSGKSLIWRENTGLLSMTRTPTNPLMWAHYADQHRGMVIGVDAVAAGFTDEQANLIPAQFGSVIYVSRRPAAPFVGKAQTGLHVGATHHFPHDHYEKLQRLFLHKPICWSYEEEVRVVKCLKGISQGGTTTPSGHFETTTKDGRVLYLYSLPKHSIRELYVGFRADPETADTLVGEAYANNAGLSAFQCHLDDGALSVAYSEYSPSAAAAAAAE